MDTLSLVNIYEFEILLMISTSIQGVLNIKKINLIQFLLTEYNSKFIKLGLNILEEL